MKRSYIGEIGELSVFNELLKRNYEVYRAISRIQKDWDLVVILENDIVKRIQVKATILQNKSKNNSFLLKDKYDLLIVVVIDENNKFNYFILTKTEVVKIIGKNKRLSVSCKKKDKFKVKKQILGNADKWEKIKETKNAKNN